MVTHAMLNDYRLKFPKQSYSFLGLLATAENSMKEIKGQNYFIFNVKIEFHFEQ